MTPLMTVKIYKDPLTNREPFIEWLENIGDSATEARARQRIRRMELGNLGDHRPVGDSVFELRLHFGSGYRVYFGKVGSTVILLLMGGDKHSQKRDIQKAKYYLHEYKTNQRKI